MTHLDEVHQVNKLWPLILNGELLPLFLCHGQDVTSDYTEDVLSFLLSRAFPFRLFAYPSMTD